MNVSVIAFAVMGIVSIILLAAIVMIEWKSKLQPKARKPDFPEVKAPDRPAALMEHPIMASHPAPESGPESLISSS